MAKERDRASRRRLVLSVLLWTAGAVALLAAVRRVEAFAKTDAQFTLERPRSGRGESILVDGVVYSSRTRILRVFEGDIGRSVFSMPLAERRRRLLAIDWVEDATISRLWPNRIWVKIAERRPVAFVHLPLGPKAGSKLGLIDAHGVILEQPAQGRFQFPVISGVTPDQPEPERRRRVEAMLDLLADLGAGSRQVSEVNVSALDNLSIMAQVEGRTIELALGDMHFGRRFQSFLTHYQEISRRTPHAASFDLRLDDRITAKE
jgi:cell division protein FtsQ